MALTLINSPHKIAPVYNPNWIVYSSTTVTNPNFDYVFDIYKSTGTTIASSPFLRVRVPPEPENQFGIYNPQKVLQAFVNPTFSASVTGCTPQSFIEYTFKVGEAYTYFTTFFTSGLASIGGVLYNVFNTTQPHLFANGDNVLVTQTGGTGNFNGTWEVVSAITSTSFALNVPFQVAIASGTTVLSNLSPTTFSGLTTFSGNVAHNAAIDTYDYITYNPTIYYPNTSVPAPWYTDTPNGWKIRRNNRAVLSYITEYPNGSAPIYSAVTRLSIVVERANGALDRYFIPLTCSEEVMYVGVGAWNLENSAGLTPVAPATLPIWQSDDVDYTVQLRNGTTPLSQDFLFTFYDFCGKWDNYEIIFMDRKGNWIPFNFELVQRQNISSSKEVYKRGLGRWDGSKMTYNSYDRGSTNYKNTINYQYTIISNWLNENQSLYYEELFTSPEVYWNYDGNGTYLAVNISQTAEEIKNKKNSRLIQYTLQFTLANNAVVQTGS